MKISTRGRYALRMMLDIARHGAQEKPVSLASVSERTAISHGYLEQVALALRSARLVRGVAHGSPEDGLARERTLFCDLMVSREAQALMATMVEGERDIRDMDQA